MKTLIKKEFMIDWETEVILYKEIPNLPGNFIPNKVSYQGEEMEIHHSEMDLNTGCLILRTGSDNLSSKASLDLHLKSFKEWKRGSEIFF